MHQILTGRPRLESGERRRAIVEAAMPLFARSGFAGTTTREIARAAGVSEALLFQHFPSKAALYQEILATGCEGDPGLDKLATLEPSTRTLVRMVQLLLVHFVAGAVGDPDERDVRHRLLLQSYLADGDYARLSSGWVMEHVFPLMRASLERAIATGEALPGGRVENLFWFAHHVAAMIAATRLNGASAVPVAGDEDVLLDDAARFILRGIGLLDATIERHLVWDMDKR